MLQKGKEIDRMERRGQYISPNLNLSIFRKIFSRSINSGDTIHINIETLEHI
jgi:hypothetical protein